MAKQRCHTCQRTRKVGEDAFIRYSYRLWCPKCYAAMRDTQQELGHRPIPMCFNCKDEPATVSFVYGSARTELCKPCELAWTEALNTYGGRTKPTLRERMGAS